VQSLQKKQKLSPTEMELPRKKAFHFGGSSTFVGDKFFLVPARPGWSLLLSLSLRALFSEAIL
jgi:hypothetical protein